MTTVAVDPIGPAAASKPGRLIRKSGAGRRRPIERGRILAVVGIGAALVGGFAAANTLLSGFAGPPPRAAIKITSTAAEWPDLRDGVPALATAPATSPSPAPRTEPAPAPAAAPLRAALDAPVPPPAMPAQAAAKPPAKLLSIETAATVAPSREASPLAPPPRVAALVKPLASETVRARTAAASSFTSLESEDTTASVAEPVKAPVAREPAKPRARTAAVKPARTTATTAEPAPAAAAAEADSDETEVLGLKVPTLAATGRKLREVFGGGDAPTAAAQ